MITRILSYLIMALSYCYATVSLAADRYQVDVIVFSHISQKTLSSEFWRSSPSWLDTKKPITLFPYDEESASKDHPTLTLLPESHSMLKREASRLATLKGTKIITQTTWQMTKKELQHPTTIALRGGDFVSPSMLNQDQLGTPSLSLSGSMTISLKRFFNTRFKLTLSKPASEVSQYLKEDRNCSFDGVCRFYFQRTRRTRSKQLNYIDTPLLGVLFQITPIAISKAD